MLEGLTVFHHAFSVGSEVSQSWEKLKAVLPKNTFYLKTCQRIIVIFKAKVQTAQLFLLPADFSKDFEVFHEDQAYGFLLQVATGLKSEVLGETEILGQLKTAWREFETNANPQSLQAVFQRLFEDAKEIRHKYLQKIGTGSYGSLVRKILQKRDVGSPILLVGAGQLAESILPWVSQYQKFVMNRNPERLVDLKNKGFDFEVFQEQTHSQSDLSGFQAVILATPQVSAAFKKKLKQSKNTLIFDLSESGIFSNSEKPAQMVTLKDLFEIQKSENLHKTNEAQRAMKACAEKAIFRKYQNFLTMTHGWEDLWSYPIAQNK